MSASTLACLSDSRTAGRTIPGSYKTKQAIMEQCESTKGLIIWASDRFYISSVLSFLFKYLPITFFLILSGTYFITSCRFYIGLNFGNRRFKGLEPLTLPYFIPWVGTGLEILLNPHKFYSTTFAKAPDHGPVRVRVANLHMYFIAGAERIQTVFRNSKDLSFEFMQLRVAEKVKGLPSHDAMILGADDSGTQAISMSSVPENARIWRRLHNIYAENLAHGKAVNFLTSRFMTEFSDQLDGVARGGSIRTPLYALLQDRMFKASTMTLAGPHVLLSEDFVKYFWEYDAAFMTLLQGTPRFLCRRGWKARDKCLDATKRWLTEAWDKIDWALIDREDPDWDECFGHRLVRAREQSLASYGVSLEGRASLQLGLIWAINANAIPMAAYILIELIKDSPLLQRVRAELLTAKTTGLSELDSSSIDIQKLCSLPLLTSVYKECLRLRASIPLTRRLRNSIEVDGYILKAGNFILAPSWLSHMDSTVWATPEHPADTFWAERFIAKEGSGSNNIKAGDFFPYGGGSIICPGRFFAKQEILAAVMMMVLKFELAFIENVKLDGKTRSERGPDVKNCESRGIIPLDRDIVIELRRRDD